MSITRNQIIEYIPRLRRYARALMRGDVLAADDLVQDCLERALTRLTLWQRGTDLRAWLFTILHNLYVNHVRRQSLVSAVEIPGDPPIEATKAGSSPVSWLELERALGALSSDQQEIVLMVGLEGLSYRQVASILGVPEGTVMSRLARARAQLRRSLSGEPETSLRRIK